jgi:hypothetical protein
MKVTGIHHVKMHNICESRYKTILIVGGHLSVGEKYVLRRLKHPISPKEG